MISISKKDIWWSYFSQFFNLTAGTIVLPIVLNKLSANEIGMNYLMLTIGSLVTLFDFGFAPQFGRNITYVFSGTQELKKEGLEIVNLGDNINYRLLATMIHTARFVYRRLSIIVLSFMITIGSAYIYFVTDGFSNVDNSLIIWLIYCGSIFFNIYYSYYTSLLTGKGLIMEDRKASMFSRLTYVFLAATLLFLNVGLLGVALASLISPFVYRYISYYYFFSNDLRKQIDGFTISNQEKFDLFKIIWYNSKKLGLVFIGAYAVNKLGFFMAGLFLPLSEIASYGLLIQLVEIISGMSGTLFIIYQPRFSFLRVKGDNDNLIRDFAFTMNVRYVIFILGMFFLMFIGQNALMLIGSNTFLPGVWIISIYTLITLLEGNHSSYATLISTGNNIPFVLPSLITGGFIALGSYLSLQFTNLNILGLILIQGLAHLAYSNWKWPLVICREFNISFKSLIIIGYFESINRAKIYFYEKFKPI